MTDARTAESSPRAMALNPGFRLAIPLFLVLMLALAALGVVNQRLYATQLSLMDTKEELTAAVATARPHAAVVNGPLSVSAWAAANGMVPLPEARTANLIAPTPAPVYDEPPSSLELRTIWR